MCLWPIDISAKIHITRIDLHFVNANGKIEQLKIENHHFYLSSHSYPCTDRADHNYHHCSSDHGSVQTQVATLLIVFVHRYLRKEYSPSLPLFVMFHKKSDVVANEYTITQDRN